MKKKLLKLYGKISKHIPFLGNIMKKTWFKVRMKYQYVWKKEKIDKEYKKEIKEYWKKYKKIGTNYHKLYTDINGGGKRCQIYSR